MKAIIHHTLALTTLCSGWVAAQVPENYTNFIRQVQYPGEAAWDATGLAASDADVLSKLPIDPGGARFELWTVDSNGPTSYLLANTFVGTLPVAEVVIRSEDLSASVARTRADRPFSVDVTISGISSDLDASEIEKSVKFLRHVQSYGENGTGVDLDRSQATLLTQSSITTNGTQTFTFLINEVPGPDRAKVRGEERFSVFSLEDKGKEIPESLLSSQTIQVWPMTEGTISGITPGELVRFTLPPLTVTLKDLYPSSTTYVRASKGDGTPPKVISGSALVVNESDPKDRTLTVEDYDSVFDSDGTWTLELVTVTPFGTDLVGSSVTFELDRTIEMNGSFTTVE